MALRVWGTYGDTKTQLHDCVVLHFCVLSAKKEKRPLDFIARLAALVPKPRVNLTRFQGVFAPNSKHRA
ncbi:MAG: hypothetical protein GKR94_08215 [Gammaproteobacteria bacterium]|nr:hypothetical protein [Gammaproteobacteria bacterium]